MATTTPERPAPELREREQLAALPALVAHAQRRTAHDGRIFAGVDAAAVADRAALAGLPVTRKSELTERQRDEPPFGGLVPIAAGALRRIFVSPGPIYDPEGRRRDFGRTAPSAGRRGGAPPARHRQGAGGGRPRRRQRPHAGAVRGPRRRRVGCAARGGRVDGARGHQAARRTRDGVPEGEVVHATRDLEAERRQAFALAQSLGLELGPALCGSSWVVEGDTALELVVELERRSGAVPVEWPKDRRWRVMRPAAWYFLSICLATRRASSICSTPTRRVNWLSFRR